MYGLRAVVNRCGVLAGPWQMGKVDQGFMVLWMAASRLRRRARLYRASGGEGLQVRDILHIDDLYDSALAPIAPDRSSHAGAIYNVAGGADAQRLATRADRSVPAPDRKVPADRASRGDAAGGRSLLCGGQAAACRASTGWRPQRKLDALLEDIHRWLVDQRVQLGPILGT